MDQKLSALNTIPLVDRAADFLYIVDTSAGTPNKTTPNQLLGITGAPVGDTDTQTLSAKTLTNPTINSGVLSGTLSGTYTLGGTPTFPAAVVTLTGSQTLTNKTLTSPTINTATIVNPTLTVNTVSEFTAANGVTVDGLNIKDGALNTSNSVVTSNITDSAVTSAKVATGAAVNFSGTNFGNFASGTATIPYDNTIPQITEGTEFMTQTTTPKSLTDILVIDVTWFGSLSSNANVVMALFQDATANALSATAVTPPAAGGYLLNLSLRYVMTAATMAATTFRVRLGPSAAGTLSQNGDSGTGKFNGVGGCSITITEHKA